MTDQRILELAARAARIGPVLCYESARNCLRVGDRSSYTLWRPLTDDGDAFRLALELEMPIHPCRVWKSYPTGFGDFVEASRDFLPPSDAAATRRAIVEVAAEVGKAMMERQL